MFINQNDLLLSKNLFSPPGCGISPRRCVVAPNWWKSDQIGAMGHQIGRNSTVVIECSIAAVVFM